MSCLILTFYVHSTFQNIIRASNDVSSLSPYFYVVMVTGVTTTVALTLTLSPALLTCFRLLTTTRSKKQVLGWDAARALCTHPCDGNDDDVL